MSKGKVKNLSSHPVDVSPDGRMVAPGEIVDGVDLSDDHNKALIDDESLIVVTDTKKEAK